MIFSVLISSPIGVDWRNSCLLPTKKYERTRNVLKKIAKYQNCYNGIIKKREFLKNYSVFYLDALEVKYRLDEHEEIDHAPV